MSTHEVDCEAMGAALEALGYCGPCLGSHDLHEHMAELAGVMSIYAQRNERYKGVWKQYGALANLVRSAQKMDRLMAVWWHEPEQPECNRPEHQDGHHGPECFPEPTRAPLGPEDLDDAIDCINHLLFFVRCVREGNLFGAPPERPTDRWPYGKIPEEWKPLSERHPEHFDSPSDASTLRLVTGGGDVIHERPEP